MYSIHHWATWQHFIGNKCQHCWVFKPQHRRQRLLPRPGQSRDVRDKFCFMLLPQKQKKIQKKLDTISVLVFSHISCFAMNSGHEQLLSTKYDDKLPLKYSSNIVVFCRHKQLLVLMLLLLLFLALVHQTTDMYLVDDTSYLGGTANHVNSNLHRCECRCLASSL